MRRAAIGMLAATLMACGVTITPTQPTVAVSIVPATAIALEGEAGAGDGSVRERSRASGGRTVHLAPDERRVWTFKVPAAATRYSVDVTYSNGKEGENEILNIAVDGVAISSFRNRDSGDAVEGWNLFITDSAGRSILSPGAHTLTVESRGGDGCVEIDRVTLNPAESGA